MPKRSYNKSSSIVPEKKLKNYKVPEQLLLAYTYFIDNKHEKYVSIGYNIVDFKPCVILHHIGNACVTLDTIQWLNIFIAKNNTITAILSSSEVVNIDGDFIIVNGNEKTVQINDVVVTKLEWDLLQFFIDYTHSVLFWCKHATKYVHEFYNKYLEKCIEKNVLQLDVADYFTPTDLNSKCNFSRLFYEFPILCKEKLIIDVSCNNFLKSLKNE